MFNTIHEKPLVPEWDMMVETPYDSYIEEFGWHNFVKVLPLPADKALVYEFYANLQYCEPNVVMVQGKPIDVSAKAINSFFRIKNYSWDVCPLAERWKYVERGSLLRLPNCDSTLSAQDWCQPLSTHGCLSDKPTSHALMSNMSVDVGKVISTEIMLVLDQKNSRESLGFQTLIIMLSERAGIQVDYCDGKLENQSLI